MRLLRLPHTNTQEFSANNISTNLFFVFQSMVVSPRFFCLFHLSLLRSLVVYWQSSLSSSSPFQKPSNVHDTIRILYFMEDNFALCCVRIYPCVNSRAELVTLAPGLRPERRFASYWLVTKVPISLRGRAK